MTITAILMALVYIVIVCLVLGLILYIVRQFIPLDAELHRIINIAVYVIALVLVIVILLKLVQGTLPAISLAYSATAFLA